MRAMRWCMFEGLGACAIVVLASQAKAADITILNRATAGGYHFTNFDGPFAGNIANAGTNMNGIANDGTAVGFDIGYCSLVG